MWKVVDTVPEVVIRLKDIFQKKVDDEEPPDKIWLTDTVYCGRKKLFSMMGMRQRFSEESLSKIWLGILVHEALQSLGIASEVRVEYAGIGGRVDVLLDSNEPLEVKVTSSTKVIHSSYAQSHVEQLSRYALAMNSETGILLYYVPGARISSLPVYRYWFDLDMVRKVTDERIDLLKQAVSERDPFRLPATWHSPDMNNWECRKCGFQRTCIGGGWIV